MGSEPARSGAGLLRRARRDELRLRGELEIRIEGSDDRLSLRLDEPRLDEPCLNEGEDVSPIQEISANSDRLEDFKSKIEALGYRCSSRSDRIVVDLEQWQAEVMPEANRQWLGTASFSVLAAEGGDRREALALLLLRASGSVRVARGYLLENRAGFAARIPGAAGEEGIVAAFEALAVCCRHFAKSISVLQNEEATKAYLAFSTI